jgi:predicted  nucleic acid-binding Zn-ribbon protein
VLLPGGIEQYLEERSAAATTLAARPGERTETASARERRTGKELSRIENQLGKLDQQIERLHHTMAAAAADHVRLGELNDELSAVVARKESLEEEWLSLAED